MGASGNDGQISRWDTLPKRRRLRPAIRSVMAAPEHKRSGADLCQSRAAIPVFPSSLAGKCRLLCRHFAQRQTERKGLCRLALHEPCRRDAPDRNGKPLRADPQARLRNRFKPARQNPLRPGAIQNQCGDTVRGKPHHFLNHHAPHRMPQKRESFDPSASSIRKTSCAWPVILSGAVRWALSPNPAKSGQITSWRALKAAS